MMKIKYIFLCLIMIMTSTVKIYALENEKKFVFGGNLVNESVIDNDLEVVDSKEEYYDLNRFFRPSDRKSVV